MAHHRPPPRTMPPGGLPPGPRRPRQPMDQPQEQFGALEAAALYCPKCRTATPVREHLLLVLPNGDLYDYRCRVCGTSTGTRTVRQGHQGRP
ncbi:MAG: hypothetical protein AB1515_08885 [Nitrospirota bacterium]